MRLTSIYRYPIKSTRGEALRSAVVEPWGLGGDRRWMLADADGSTVTAREYPTLLLVSPQLTEDGVLLRGPGRDELAVSVPDTAAMIGVHGRAPFPVVEADAAASAWFSEYLGVAVRLYFSNDPSRRRLNPKFARKTDSASFADAYPLLLTTEESLARLNDWIAAGPLAHEGPLDMRRFRPNVLVSGAPPFSEDNWRRVRIGEAVFRTPKGCDRCVMTTTDPDTAGRGKEPIATLARHRRFDGATWFGMNLIPDSPGASIEVGDEVEVLDAVDSDGPPR